METRPLDRGLFQTTASNGLTILTEAMPGVRSVAVGVWVRSASAHESPTQMGAAHMLEHLVFKGTERRTARQLAVELEARGGSLDAYTGRDHTNFQAHILDADLPRAVDVLTDLVRRPLLRQQDLDLERNVVLEEISMVEDTPDDLVFELHSRALYPDHPYGYSILGTRETVSALSAEGLRGLHDRGYLPGNVVVAAAGRLEHDQVLGLLEHEGWLEPGAGSVRPEVRPVAAVRGAHERHHRDTAQTHIVIGTDTFPTRDPRRWALSVVTNVFGGGMSSRLFQRIREELGLAYAVYAFQSLYQASGQVGSYIGTQPATADQALDAIMAEYLRLAREGLTPDELADGKQQLKGQIMLGLESPMSRMGRMASVALGQDRYRDLDQLLAEVDAITADDVAAITAEYFAPERQTVVRLGPEK
ncbi:MAG TPA: pitrilysin family protein [Gemmatimonadales bacterium]|nr:pitrilysin family protein [Gemmatimonadales bacterium]